MSNLGNAKVTKYIEDFISNLPKHQFAYINTYKSSLFTTISELRKRNTSAHLISAVEAFLIQNEEFLSILALRIVRATTESKENEHICNCESKEQCEMFRMVYEGCTFNFVKRLARINPKSEIAKLESLLNNGREFILLIVWQFLKLSYKRKTNEQINEELFLLGEIEAFALRKEDNDENSDSSS